MEMRSALEVRSGVALFVLYLPLAFGSTPPTKLSTGVAVLQVAARDTSEVTAAESDLEMLGGNITPSRKECLAGTGSNGREQESMLTAADCATANDLTTVVDAPGHSERPSGVRGSPAV